MISEADSQTVDLNVIYAIGINRLSNGKKKQILKHSANKITYPKATCSKAAKQSGHISKIPYLEGSIRAVKKRLSPLKPACA